MRRVPLIICVLCCINCILTYLLLSNLYIDRNLSSSHQHYRFKYLGKEEGGSAECITQDLHHGKDELPIWRTE